MEFQNYTSLLPQSITVSPIRTAAVEGLPIIRIEKETGANERKCTDTGSSLIFLFFLAICTYVLFLGVFHGNAARLTHGVNYNGGICGASASLLQYPYLYYPLDPGSSTPRLLPSARKCVRLCPTEADVRAGRVVPITRNQFERNLRGTSSTLIEYTGRCLCLTDSYLDGFCHNIYVAD